MTPEAVIGAFMKGITFRYGCLFLVVTGVASYLWLGIYHERRMREFEKTGWTPRKVERVLKRSPPAGSTRDQIETWLASQPFETHANWDQPLQDIGMAREAGLDARDLGGFIRAEVPDPHESIWDTRCSISIVFYFDKASRLVKHQVRVWVEGL